jgi:hypothetical protein
MQLIILAGTSQAFLNQAADVKDNGREVTLVEALA